MKYKVWKCKIVIEEDDLPSGFDYPPRHAAIKAVENAGFAVIDCFSGWGGSLTDREKAIVDYDYSSSRDC